MITDPFIDENTAIGNLGAGYAVPLAENILFEPNVNYSFVFSEQDRLFSIGAGFFLVF